jgi:hypothetical protein
MLLLLDAGKGAKVLDLYQDLRTDEVAANAAVLEEVVCASLECGLLEHGLAIYRKVCAILLITPSCPCLPLITAHLITPYCPFLPPLPLTVLPLVTPYPYYLITPYMGRRE